MSDDSPKFYDPFGWHMRGNTTEGIEQHTESDVPVMRHGYWYRPADFGQSVTDSDGTEMYDRYAC